MDKLERFLDRVCGSVGGPRELRQHLRLELREHLLDAVARHQSEGFSADDAVERALREFGEPDAVRAELESTHGHRLLGILIERALTWKETTMKAKWFWTLFAHTGVLAVIALDLLFVVFTSLMILPKFKKMRNERILDLDDAQESSVTGIVNFLDGLQAFIGNIPIWYAFPPLLIWVAFEWRVRSENKSLMRLTGLGITATAMTVLATVVGAMLAVCFCVGIPAVGKLARPFAIERVTLVETELIVVDPVNAQTDWSKTEQAAEKVSDYLDSLASVKTCLPALQTSAESGEDLSVRLRNSREHWVAVRNAIRDKDMTRLSERLRPFRAEFAPIQTAARKATP